MDTDTDFILCNLKSVLDLKSGSLCERKSQTVTTTQLHLVGRKVVIDRIFQDSNIPFSEPLVISKLFECNYVDTQNVHRFNHLKNFCFNRQEKKLNKD